MWTADWPIVKLIHSPKTQNLEFNQDITDAEINSVHISVAITGYNFFTFDKVTDEIKSITVRFLKTAFRPCFVIGFDDFFWFQTVNYLLLKLVAELREDWVFNFKYFLVEHSWSIKDVESVVILLFHLLIYLHVPFNLHLKDINNCFRWVFYQDTYWDQKEIK